MYISLQEMFQEVIVKGIYQDSVSPHTAKLIFEFLEQNPMKVIDSSHDIAMYDSWIYFNVKKKYLAFLFITIMRLLNL